MLRVMSQHLLWVALLFCLIAVIYYCLAIYSTLDFLKQKIPIDPDFHPPITILKPICGIDNNAYENLASFCRQDYPTYQVIFGVQDPQDPGIAVIKQLMQAFPETDIDLIISDRAIGQNLKISNLANAAELAKHNIFLIADSDIQVTSDYLTTVVQPLQDAAVGVVTCLYRSRFQNWISAFLALIIATEYMPPILISRKLEGMTFGLGATVVIRRSVLDEMGGFAAVADYLHDDFLLGNRPTQQGHQVVLSNYVVQHELATETIADFLKLLIRWNRNIRFSHPWGYLGQLFTFGTVASLGFLLTMQGAAVGWSVLGIVWLARLVMAWVVGVLVLQDEAVKRYWWLVPLSDLVRFALWCASFVGNTIEWRGRRLQLTKDGRIVEAC